MKLLSSVLIVSILFGYVITKPIDGYFVEEGVTVDPLTADDNDLDTGFGIDINNFMNAINMNDTNSISNIHDNENTIVNAETNIFDSINKPIPVPIPEAVEAANVDKRNGNKQLDFVFHNVNKA